MPVDVQVTGGTVRGAQEDGILTFRGIPFASLPARFGAPQPVSPWEGPRPAIHFGPPPPQAGDLDITEPTTQGDEWLTLNIWSPDLDGAVPVMVWIQGGAYVFGTSGLPEYDGATLALGGIVLVTFNYRVGLEGFGYVDGTPANRGLLDQVAALHWVRTNIAAFGGDPGRVTVFGQSAGGGSVAALMAMPSAAGLFCRAIAQSVQGTFFTPALAADVARTCAAELGLKPADLPTVEPALLTLASDTVAEQIDRYADRLGSCGARSSHVRSGRGRRCAAYDALGGPDRRGRPDGRSHP